MKGWARTARPGLRNKAKRTGPGFLRLPLEEPPWPASPSRQGGAYPCSARDSPGGSKEPLSPQGLALLPALPPTWANHCEASPSSPLTCKQTGWLNCQVSCELQVQPGTTLPSNKKAPRRRPIPLDGSSQRLTSTCLACIYFSNVPSLDTKLWLGACGISSVI